MKLNRMQICALAAISLSLNACDDEESSSKVACVNSCKDANTQVTCDANGNAIDAIQQRIQSGIITEGSYMSICMWLLALLVFTYALSTVLRAILLKFFYDVEGDKKKKMYEELEAMRAKRHTENENKAVTAAEKA